MKRIYVLFTALCVCCALAAQDIKELLILHTNDTHSRVEPIPITDPNPEFAGKAGFVRRVTLIKEIRKQCFSPFRVARDARVAFLDNEPM